MIVSSTKSVTLVRDEPITRIERLRYNQLLKEVKESIQIVEHSLLKIAKALKEIQTERLYRAKYDTFELFIQAELGKTRQYGYRLINAGAVLDGLLEQGIREENLPNTERLCLELARIKDKKLRKNIWQRVELMAQQEDRPIDTTLIKRAMDESQPPKRSARKTDDSDRNHVKEVVKFFKQANSKLSFHLDFSAWKPEELNHLRTLVDNVAIRMHQIREQLKKHGKENESPIIRP